MRELLASHPFLAGLPGRDLDRLSYWARKAVFHEGRRVFEEGGRADRFWLLREGRVSVDLRTLSGGLIHLESLTGGDVLGWSWLSPPHRWKFGAVATQPTLAIELDAHGVREMCDTNPVLGYELYRRFNQILVNRLDAVRTIALASEAARPRTAAEREIAKSDEFSTLD